MLTRRSTFPLWFAAAITIRQPVDDGGDNIVTRRLLMHQIVEDVLNPLPVSYTHLTLPTKA